MKDRGKGRDPNLYQTLLSFVQLDYLGGSMQAVRSLHMHRRLQALRFMAFVAVDHGKGIGESVP